MDEADETLEPEEQPPATAEALFTEEDLAQAQPEVIFTDYASI